MLDNQTKKGYNMQAVREGVDGEIPRVKKSVKKWKKLKKLLKKVLTKGKRCGIIVKLSARKGNGERTVIENWTTREKYKAYKNSASARSRRKSYILNKVKEAKKE